MELAVGLPWMQRCVRPQSGADVKQNTCLAPESHEKKNEGGKRCILDGGVQQRRNIRERI